MLPRGDVASYIVEDDLYFVFWAHEPSHCCPTAEEGRFATNRGQQ